MMNCQPVDVAYFDSAPVRMTSEIQVRATPEQVFACLEDADAWAKWSPAIKRVEWTAPKPFGLGTTRTVHMIGGMVAEEEFIAWEPLARMAFYFTRANVPMASFAEDYVVSGEDGALTIRWTMAMTPTGFSKYTMRLFGPGMRSANQWMLGRLGKLIETEYT